MKLTVELNPELNESEITIKTNQIDEKLQELINYLNFQNEENIIYGKFQDRSYKVNFDDVTRIYAQDKNVYIKINNSHSLQSDLRLYQFEDLLSKKFIRISKSELINVKWIDYLKLDATGIIKICFVDKDYTYSSRRYLKKIKEQLKL